MNTKDKVKSFLRMICIEKPWICISILTVILLLSIGILIYVYNTKGGNLQESLNNSRSGNTNSSLATVNVTPLTVNSTAITLVDKKSSHCKALAPNDYAFTSNTLSTAADLYSSDRVVHAGWWISPVTTGNNIPYSFPTVDSFLTYWLGYAITLKIDGISLTLDTPKTIAYDFIQRDLTTNTGRKGSVIYKVYNFGSPIYVVSMYMADTPSNVWDTRGAEAFYSAISIRCVSQTRPSTSSTNYSGSDPSNKSDNPEVDLSDKWTEAIMGYENVYSSTTGEHYEAPVNSYWDTGPEGGGYYRDLPNGGYEKLNDGFGDY